MLNFSFVIPGTAACGLSAECRYPWHLIRPSDFQQLSLTVHIKTQRQSHVMHRANRLSHSTDAQSYLDRTSQLHNYRYHDRLRSIQIATSLPRFSYRCRVQIIPTHAICTTRNIAPASSSTTDAARSTCGTSVWQECHISAPVSRRCELRQKATYTVKRHTLGRYSSTDPRGMASVLPPAQELESQ